ncbi:MAG: acetyltransferase [Deferrisomatales bacterium]
MTAAGERDRVFVFGASGHAKVVIDAIERLGRFEVTFLVDDDPSLAGRDVYGYRVRGGGAALAGQGIRCGIVAIGQNAARLAVARWLVAEGFELMSAVHPSAQLGRGVVIGRGTVVMAGAVVNADTRIGDHVIVNTGARVDHDCRVGEGAHLGPGSTLCGGVSVGEGALVGAGATVVPNRSIGPGAVIGAGAVVLRDVPANGTAVGVPARLLAPVTGAAPAGEELRP